jgi:hypothetical protein
MSATSTALRPTLRAATTRSAFWAVPAGMIGGIVLGIVARLWMRWISSDPEFSWAGTLFIIGAFAVAGLWQAAAWAARRAGWRRWVTTVVRTAAVIFTLPIFTGAGSIMLPTAVAASLAAWRTDWPRALRVLLAVLAAPAALFVVSQIVAEFGWSPATLGRIALFAGIYVIVVTALQPSVAPLADGWRVPRVVRIGAVVVPAAGLIALAAATLL